MRNELLVTLLRQHVVVLFRQIPPMRAKDNTGEVKTYTVHGTFDWDKTIVIDLRKMVNPARAFLHELLHKLRGDEVSETEIIKQERKLWKQLTQYERWIVYRILFHKEWVDDDET